MGYYLTMFGLRQPQIFLYKTLNSFISGSESSLRISKTTSSTDIIRPIEPIQYNEEYGFCLSRTSNAIVKGICSDMVSVPISEEVRKQPHSQRATASTVQMKPFKKSMPNCPWLGISNVSILVKCNIKKMGHSSNRFQRPTKPVMQTK